MAEFDTFESFLDWFENQKPEWQPILAARIALRALPLAFSNSKLEDVLSVEGERALLQLFRAVLALDAATDDHSAINSRLFSDADEFFASEAHEPVPQGASRLALLLTNYLKFIGNFIELEHDSLGISAKPFRDRRISASQYDLVNETALSEDLSFLNDVSLVSVIGLNTKPLFSQSDSDAQLVLWPKLQSVMLSARHYWDVWAEYYAHRLEGRASDVRLHAAAQSLDKVIWTFEVAVVNARLRELTNVDRTGFDEVDQEEISDDQIAITDRESFESWLKGQPNEWAQVLAMRSALLVLPLVGQVFDAKSLKPEIQQELIFSAVRASVISWVACRYPTYDMADATNSADAAAKAADIAKAANNVAADAAGLATRAANSAALATHVTLTAARVSVLIKPYY